MAKPKSYATNKLDTMLKEVDKKYRTTLINCYFSIFNFAKYKLVMFTMAKIIEIEQSERNKITLYLFNSIKID